MSFASLAAKAKAAAADQSTESQIRTNTSEVAVRGEEAAG